MCARIVAASEATAYALPHIPGRAGRPRDPGHARGRHPLPQTGSAALVRKDWYRSSEGSEVHVTARHAATGGRGGLLRLVGDDGLGGEEQCGDGGGVLQRGTG